jgi:hypothetical protein
MRLAALLAATATFGLAAAPPADAALPCIAPTQAESLFLALAPGLVGTVAATCASSLPPTALLRTRVSQLTAKYTAESDRAWGAARESLKQLAGPDAAQLLDSDLARPMVMSLVAPLLAKEIKPAACPDIDRILTLIDPLPARNTAGLIVAIVELSQRDKVAREGSMALSICRPGPVRR